MNTSLTDRTNIRSKAISPHHCIMPKTRRMAYDAKFKLEAIDLALKKGNRAAAQELGINESMVRRWRSQRDQLTRCSKTTRAFRGKNAKWPELENELEDWINTQRADGRGVSTVQIRLKARALASAKNVPNFLGRMRRATFAEVCQWILTSWQKVKVSTIVNGFHKAEINIADDTASGSSPSGSAERESDDSDSSAANMDGRLSKEAFLQLFVSDTEDEDFSGFSDVAQDD